MTINRRTALTAFLAGAVTAKLPALSPVMAAAPPSAESPELLKLGAEIGPKLKACRAAAEGARKARDIAQSLWPTVPEKIVTTVDDRRMVPVRCYQDEKNCDGDALMPETFIENGKYYAHPVLQLFQAEPLKRFLAEHEIGPRTKFGHRLRAIIAVAEKYEKSCDEAIAASGIDVSKQAAREATLDLQNLAWAAQKLPPAATMAGVVIYVRIIKACEEVSDARMAHAGSILSANLAEGVLRVASGSA